MLISIGESLARVKHGEARLVAAILISGADPGLALGDGFPSVEHRGISPGGIKVNLGVLLGSDDFRFASADAGEEIAEIARRGGRMLLKDEMGMGALQGVVELFSDLIAAIRGVDKMLRAFGDPDGFHMHP